MSNTIWINEFHYDNTGTDVGEFIEVAGLAGTDLSGWALVLYNGADGFAYSTLELGGIIPDQSGGVGTLSFAYPENGIQNGGPDGIALVDPFGTTVEFISYEGSFDATDFFGSGTITSVDVGVAELGADAVGGSIARVGSGDTNSWQPDAPLLQVMTELVAVRAPDDIEVIRMTPGGDRDGRHHGHDLRPDFRGGAHRGGRSALERNRANWLWPRWDRSDVECGMGVGGRDVQRSGRQ